MFETLTQRLGATMDRLRGRGRLTEENIRESLREVRVALLEADVALPVVQALIERVKVRAVGQEVLKSLTPGQALVKVVRDELTVLMGSANAALDLAATPPAVVLMAGLQGAGKTTTTAKLAKWLIERQKKKVLTVSADVYRPAAIEQLRSVTAQAGAEFLPSSPQEKPLDIAARALAHARAHHFDVLLVDTAGRLAIDQQMMQEIRELHEALDPVETLFVVDSMQGQDALATARAFHDALPLTGIVLTKLDGDARGGAALSVHHVTGAPIKFAGVSEKIDGLEAFDPRRMAERILGMGDVLALVEQAQRSVDMEAAQQLARKVKSGEQFDLNDFLLQLNQMNKMGGLQGMLDKLPAEMQARAGQADMDKAARDVRRMQGIICSMTPTERRKPELIKASRKRRIAAGSGVAVQEVNRLLGQFEQMRDMMKKMKGAKMFKMMQRMGGAGLLRR